MLSNKVQAQGSKGDTLYYLLDTTKTPVKDRLWVSGKEGSFKYFKIMCECLKDNSRPTFVYKLNDKGTQIDESDFRKKNFISLSKLIKLSKQTNINKHQIIYFVEPIEDIYIKHEVHLFFVRKRKPTIDSEIIK